MFNQIGQYFAAIKTNECNTLYIYSLLQLEGNLELRNFIGAYRNREDDKSIAIE